MISAAPLPQGLSAPRQPRGPLRAAAGLLPQGPYMYDCIYIYIERERDRDTDREREREWLYALCN